MFHSLQYITSLDIQTIWVQMHTTQSKPTSDLQPLSLFTWSLQCFQREEELTQKGKTIIIGVFQSMQQNQLENNFQNMKNIKRQPRIYILQQLSASLLPLPLPLPPPHDVTAIASYCPGKKEPSHTAEAHSSYSLTGFAIQQHGELHFSTSLTLCNLTDFAQMG